MTKEIIVVKCTSKLGNEFTKRMEVPVYTEAERLQKKRLKLEAELAEVKAAEARQRYKDSLWIRDTSMRDIEDAIEEFLQNEYY